MRDTAGRCGRAFSVAAHPSAAQLGLKAVDVSAHESIRCWASQGREELEIWLVRHGETALNAARILQPADTPLSAHGLRQAHALAERLAGEPIAGILSSDLPRAQQTAEAIASRTGHALRTTPLLHERSFGDWRGQPYDSLSTDPLAMEAAPPGGESATQFVERCRLAFEHALQLQMELGGPLVVVTHGLVIRQMLAALPPAARSGAELPRMGNTSLSILDATPPHAVRLLNCVRHLDRGLLEGAESLSGG
jgi:broad specificity phosphatase PhoE